MGIAAAGAASLLPSQPAAAAEGDGAIRPLRINVPEAKLVDLRRRIAEAQWPEKETVGDASPGRPLRSRSADRPRDIRTKGDSP